MNDTVEINDQQLSALIREELAHHAGSEQLFRLPFGLIITEGVKHWAELCGAWWALDTLCLNRFPKEDFVHVVLKSEDNSAIFTWDDGNGNVLGRYPVAFTDCPPGEWRFYIENGVICLPQER